MIVEHLPPLECVFGWGIEAMLMRQIQTHQLPVMITVEVTAQVTTYSTAVGNLAPSQELGKICTDDGITDALNRCIAITLVRMRGCC